METAGHAGLHSVLVMAVALCIFCTGCDTATLVRSSDLGLGGTSSWSPSAGVGGSRIVVAGIGPGAPVAGSASQVPRAGVNASATAGRAGSVAVGSPNEDAGLAGLAGLAGRGGMAGMGAPRGGSAAPAPGSDMGKGDGSDVITIGDSWMLLRDGLGIEVSLERFAMNDYRNYGVPGTRIEQILVQYEDAKREDPEIRTVVMTGGGNDILLDFGIPDCAELGPMCRAVIDSVSAKIGALWEDMAEDGVQNVFIIGYARPQIDLFQLGRTLEYSGEVTAMGCEEAPLPCTFIDSVEVFGGEEHISFDHIHPDAAGYDLIGKATYEAMERVGARR